MPAGRGWIGLKAETHDGPGRVFRPHRSRLTQLKTPPAGPSMSVGPRSSTGAAAPAPVLTGTAAASARVLRHRLRGV